MSKNKKYGEYTRDGEAQRDREAQRDIGAQRDREAQRDGYSYNLKKLSGNKKANVMYQT